MLNFIKMKSSIIYINSQTPFDVKVFFAYIQ
ncbi:hypothetical protein AAUPMC_04876 [Pasteurella multocida subsp. multocida str. Anand1_cattle]|nr:hypothetical protein AAUPMC_04876 [Pasteurella multocida subsp. multocida str. Anand1_cattle]